MKKCTWKYWTLGLKRPKKLPKGCNVYYGWQSTDWEKETLDPKDWTRGVRSWKVEDKTCKWRFIQENLTDPHGNIWSDDYKPRHCECCGKPVEIMKKKVNPENPSGTARDWKALLRKEQINENRKRRNRTTEKRSRQLRSGDED